MRRFAQYCIMAVVISILCSTAQAENQWHIDAGPLKLDVYISETSALFHAVDGLSQSRSDYVTPFEKLNGELSKNDKDLLAQHAAVSKVLNGNELEEAFSTSLNFDEALDLAVSKHLLTEQEAQTERLVFTHFKPSVDRLISEWAPNLTSIIEELQLKKQDLTAFATTMSRFTGCGKLLVTVYLFATPGYSIGSFVNNDNGLAIVALRVANNTASVYETLVQDIVGVYFATKRSAFAATAGSVDGLKGWVLSQSLSYAYSPGMMGDTGRRELINQASEMITKGSDLSDSYVVRYLYGLALQPLLKQALNDSSQTLETFLPKAADAWLVLQSLHMAMKPGSKLYEGHDYRNDQRHSILEFGDISDKELIETLVKTSHLHFFGRPHEAKYYKELLTDIAKPGDTILLLLSLDDPARVPEEFHDLLPVPWSQLESKLKQGQSVIKWGKARGMTVLLIATPTKEELRKELRYFASDPKAFPQVSNISYGNQTKATTATITAVYWKSPKTLPRPFRADQMGKTTDILIRIKEYFQKESPDQLSALYSLVGHYFVLKASGHPDVRISMDGFNYSDTSTKFCGYGLQINLDDRKKLKSGVTYKLISVDEGQIPWRINGVTFKVS